MLMMTALHCSVNLFRVWVCWWMLKEHTRRIKRKILIPTCNIISELYFVHLSDCIQPPLRSTSVTSVVSLEVSESAFDQFQVLRFIQGKNRLPNQAVLILNYYLFNFCKLTSNIKLLNKFCENYFLIWKLNMQFIFQPIMSPLQGLGLSTELLSIPLWFPYIHDYFPVEE